MYVYIILYMISQYRGLGRKTRTTWYYCRDVSQDYFYWGLVGIKGIYHMGIIRGFY